jgi:hypothetical protein
MTSRIIQPNLKGRQLVLQHSNLLFQLFSQLSRIRLAPICTFAGYVESRVKYAVWNLFKRERRRWQQEVPLAGGGNGDEEKSAPSWLDTLAATHNVEDEVEAGFI